MKAKIRRTKKVGKPQRVLLFADDLYVMSFPSENEAKRWVLQTSGHWNDNWGKPIPDPVFTYVTEYLND